ncbi:MAG: zinc-dependent metalloprotease [Myxococcota bacterium]|nr:zinc-dependent metalloprotease [Myxococcota bacterium]
MRASRLTKIIALVAAVALIAPGCTQRLGDIDQTRPNIVDKSLFQGEWYYRQMVTDIPYFGAYLTGAIIGSATGLSRIRWEIREKELIAIDMDEMSPGRNDIDKDDMPEEFIVARYPILGHMDVRRQYDSQTGEENNVLYEDGSSRKWYDREQMLVDWSRNQTGLADMLGPTANHMVQTEASNDDDPYLLDIQEDHINVTTKHVIGMGASSMISVFTSILKIDPNNDYQELKHPAQVPQRDAFGELITDSRGDPIFVDVFSRYGFFQTEVQNYDQFDGDTWATRHYRANRFNMWKKNVDANGVLIPIQERELDPIVYFMAEDYPEEMIPAAKRIGQIWNTGFVKALTDVGYPTHEQTVAFAVCANPVTENSPEVCRAKGLGIKLFGDLRYNFLKLARPAGTSNPLGYGPGSHDQRTGETVNAWAVTYYAGLNSYAKRALDMVKLYNGIYSKDSTEWLEGEYFKGLQTSLDNQFSRERSPMSGRMPAVDSELHAFNKEIDSNLDKLEMKRQLKEIEQNMHQALKGDSVASKLSKEAQKHHHAFHGFDDEAFEGFVDPNMSASKTAELLRNLRENSVAGTGEAIFGREQILQELGEQTVYMQEFLDPTVGYIAARIARQYPYPPKSDPDYDAKVLANDEKILKALRDAIYIGVQLHEVGHNLGLRHNFAGSTDEMNYIQPGVSTPVVPDDVFVGESGDGMKGYWDAVLTNEDDIPARLEYQYSSIMDYGANFGSDIHGLGAYDVAAIRFGYFNHIEMYDNGHPLFEQSRQGQLAKVQTRSYAPFDANRVSFDQYGLEMYQDPQGGSKYLNKHEFCTDTFADGFNLNCSRWDVGTSPVEIAYLYGERVRQAYWMSNYTRGKVTGYSSFNGGLIGGLFSRYFMYATRAGLLASYIGQIYGYDAHEALSSDNRQLGYYYSVAGYAMNEVVNTIMTPDVGSHSWSTQGQTPVLYKSNRGGAAANFTNSDSAHPRYSKYTLAKDEWSTVSRYGFYNNKLAAIISLFSGFGTNLEQFMIGEVNNRYSSMSLANAFKAETVEILKSLLMDDTSRYAHLPLSTTGSVASSGDQVREAVASDRIINDILEAQGKNSEMSRLANQRGGWDKVPKIDNNRTDYEMQYAFMYAMSYLRSIYDRTWNNYLFLHQAGDNLGREYPDPSRVVRWEDDAMGVIWEAYRYDTIKSINGRNVDPSIAADFIQSIKDTVPQLQDNQLDNYLSEVRYKLDFLYNMNIYQ